MRKLIVVLCAGILLSASAMAITKNNCSPMAKQDFRKACAAIEEAGFLDDKVAEVDKILEKNCLSSQQLKELLMLFEFENIKLAIAQRAYQQLSDAENFKSVFDVFEFDDSVARLQEVLKD